MKTSSTYEIFGNVIPSDALEALAQKINDNLALDDLQRDAVEDDDIPEILRRLDGARYPEEISAEYADERTPIYNWELLGKTWELYRLGWMEEAQSICEKGGDIIRLHSVAWYLALERAYSEAVRLAEEYAPDFVTLYVVRVRENGDVIDTFETIEEAKKEIQRYEAEDEKEGTFTPHFYEIVETTPGLLE